MRCRVAIVLGVVAVLSSTARAQPGATPAPAPEARTDRYGASIAAIDALAVGVSALGLVVGIATAGTSEDDSSLGKPGAVIMFAGLAAYVAGGPYLHHRHHNRRGAWTSLGVRIGLPVVGALVGEVLIGEEARNNPVPNDDDDLPAQLFVAGVAAAMVVDWLVLAKVTVSAAPAPGGATLGIAGAF